MLYILCNNVFKEGYWNFVLMQSTYFYFNGNVYEQRKGAAMGLPVSEVVANLYMEHFEQLALESAPSQHGLEEVC